MKPILPVLLAIAVAVLSIAAASKPSQRLTVRRVAELTAPSAPLKGSTYTVEISGLTFPQKPDGGPPPRISSRATLPGDKPEGLIEVIREYRYPIDFDPPTTSPSPDPALTAPITPRAFETTNTGWTIRLKARPAGKFIALSAIADYVEAEMMRGGYGPISGPIVDDHDRLISPNVAHQPRFQTTTTRFHIFALPGEPTEVVLYKGQKPEKHTVTVAAE